MTAAVRLRPVAPADADALVALWNHSAPHDPLTPALFHEKVWGDPDFAPERALVAEAADGTPVGFGVGVRWGAPNATRGTLKLLCVAPERRREGIGTQLADALEARLRADGAAVCRVAECSPNYLVPGVDLRDTPGWVFVQKRGYQPAGEAYNMDVDLASDDWDTAVDEARLAAEDVEVRRATAADRDAVMMMLDADWPAWKPEIATALAQAPPALWLAMRDGTVLGFSAYDANNVGTGWFGPMGTAPAARGLGIGAVLCRRCLADLAAQGRAHATIPWVAPVAFYSNVAGAHIARVFHRFEKAL